MNHINSHNQRIGIFNDSFPPIIDGVTLTVENYMHWLRTMGHEACVVTPWNPSKCDVPYEVKRYFSLAIPDRYPYRYGYPKLDFKIWREMRRTPFSLVHAHCPFSSGRLAVYAKKHQHIPLVGTFHSKYRTDLEHSFRHVPFMTTNIMRKILNFFNACDEVWIPQAQVEETAREYGFKGRLTVVENGIDYADMVTGPMAPFKAEAKREKGIGEDDLALLFIGQHINEKGIMVIADALNLIKDEIPFRMNYIGNGYALEDLKRRLARHGLTDRVTVHGMIRDRHELSRYYAASDLFLFPSMYDNAPLVVREAAAMGAPSIIPLGSTASEVIRPDKNGYLTHATPEAYADEIRRLYRDRDAIARVGIEARNTLVRSWQDVVEEVADRYAVLVKKFR